MGPAPETRKFAYSPYEQASIDAALASLKLERELAPEGKIVESVHTVRLEVFEKRDWANPVFPAPEFLNVFHTTTKDFVIRREVLLVPGDTYLQTLVDETQRNISGIGAVSLVLVVAAKGSTPDKVRIVVITKDVWSIRLQWNIALTNGGLELLEINPAETNLAGTHQNLGVSYVYQPETSTIGGRWVYPRIANSHVYATGEASIILNNRSGSAEGGIGQVDVQQPLWSTLTKWAWDAGVAWREETTRIYRNARVRGFSLDPMAKCDTASRGCVPWIYRSDLVTAQANVTRSFGWQTKHDITLGFEARRRRFCVDNPAACPELNLGLYDPATVAAFKSKLVPVSDDRVGPYLQYQTYSTDFVRVLDLETLGLQEDYRLGYRAYARVYPIFKGLGSSRDVLGFSTGLSYTTALGFAGADTPSKDGIFRFNVENVAEVDLAQGRITDGAVTSTVRLASPRAPIGRFVIDGFLLHRYENYLQRSVVLGGDSRLRGYPSRQFAGGSAATLNFEYRTRRVELFKSVELAGVLFYDVGDAFDTWRDFVPKHDAGFGTRILFPQLDRTVFRVDVGFPISPIIPSNASPVTFFVTFDQAFPLDSIAPQSAVTL